MPDGPRPADVQFDDAAAAAAIAELTTAGRVVGETEQARATATTTANDGFQGAYATSFGDASNGLNDEARSAVEGINALRRTIEDAVDEAARQRRIVAAAQADWDAQDAAERRARQEHPNIPI